MKSKRFSERFQKSERTLAAFTLVELLVVIAIIGVLVALIIPTISKINAMRAISRTKTELKEVELWISEYKAKRGYFPPDNPGNEITNQLFYELSGTIYTNDAYTTLDGSANVTQAQLAVGFGPAVSGVANTTKGAKDEGMVAQKFIAELKPGQIVEFEPGLKILVGTVGWDTSLPSPTYEPGVNPFRYISTKPTHNPNSFDLWIDIHVQGKTYRISNWSDDAIVL
jgi:prepilin-type N-terminal cleavage/methylation domain-containing protein